MKELYHNYINMDRGNCSTVIIGKKVSSTGQFILGHNEDDTDCVVQSHLVPRVKHEEGDTIIFDDGFAEIPQVPETLAYMWSDVRCEGGISFADAFCNEKGVAIVSNACRPSKDEYGCHTDNRGKFGMGYALRRLVAERANTAREGVKIAAELVEKFGYFSSRSYQIVDKDEAWVVQVPKGFNVVAKRLEEDHVYYMPNHYTIHQVDPTDTDHYYASPNLISHAIKNGWYTPAVEGDYSDFDFAKAYQEDYEDTKTWNMDRARGAWKLLTDTEITQENVRVFSRPGTRIYTPADVKKVLRYHFEGMDIDKTEGGKRNPHTNYDSVDVLCNGMTIESSVIEFNEDINLIRWNRAIPKPCLSPYTPWYPVALTKIPEGYEWESALVSQPGHFRWNKDDMLYNPNKAWFVFKTVQYLTDFNYPWTHGPIAESVAKLEKTWDDEQESIENTYKALGPVAGKAFLNDYTQAQAQKAKEWALRTVGELSLERSHLHSNEY